MSGIKYYRLKEDEELPDEFCAVKDVNGEPNEYTFYRPETENAKLRELVAELWALADGYTPDDSELDTARDIMRELGIEVEE